MSGGDGAEGKGIESGVSCVLVCRMRGRRSGGSVGRWRAVGSESGHGEHGGAFRALDRGRGRESDGDEASESGDAADDVDEILENGLGTCPCLCLCPSSGRENTPGLYLSSGRETCPSFCPGMYFDLCPFSCCVREICLGRFDGGDPVI